MSLETVFFSPPVLWDGLKNIALGSVNVLLNSTVKLSSPMIIPLVWSEMHVLKGDGSKLSFLASSVVVSM